MSMLINLYKDSFSGLSREVWLLALMMLINRSGSMVILFLTIYLTQNLNFSYEDAGIVMSCFGLGSVAGSYLGGWLNDRIGYFYVISLSLFLGGLGFIMIMNFTSMLSFCIGIFVLVTISDCARPASFAAVDIYSKPENRTRSLSLIRLAINLGLGAGPAVAGLVIAHMGYPYIFLIDGLTCILASLYFYFMFKSRNQKGTKIVEIYTAEERAKERSPYKDGIFILFTLCILISMIAFMQLFTNLPVYYKEHFLLDEHEIGLLMALNGLLIAIVEMPLIYLIERKYKNFPFIILGTALIALSYFVFNILDFWGGVVVASMLAITFGEIISFPLTNAVALERATPARRGEYMGMYSMSFAVALIIAPSLGGKIIETYGFAVLWYVMTGFSILAMLGFALLQPIYEKEKAAKKIAITE